MRGNRLADALTELEHWQDPTPTPSQSAEARLHRSFGRYAELVEFDREFHRGQGLAYADAHERLEELLKGLSGGQHG